MRKYNFIINHPDKYFSVAQISEALRTSSQSVKRWCTNKELKYTWGKVGNFPKARVVKGEWFVEYIKNLNEYPEVDGWKNLNEVLSDYKLPHERK